MSSNDPAVEDVGRGPGWNEESAHWSEQVLVLPPEDGEGQRFWLSAEPAADLLSLAERPSLSVFDAFVAAVFEVFFVLRASFCARAEPPADLLFDPVSPLRRVLDAAEAAFEDVVLPDMMVLSRGDGRSTTKPDSRLGQA